MGGRNIFASSPLPVIDRLEVSAYTVPTECPEADGTLAWNETTLVFVEVGMAGRTGFGYSFADLATAHLIDAHLKREVLGCALDIPAVWMKMVRAIRNLGRPGVCSMAISAVDNALWDLKARLLNLSVADLLGRAHPAIPAYGSGGFTSYDEETLKRQLAGWIDQGMTMVKMKIGADPGADVKRVRAARDAIGVGAELFVDANGAYGRKEALAKAEEFAGLGVTWFEEPVPSDDLDGLHLIRDRAPRGMRVAAGEYGYDAFYFRRMLEAGAVDVLQADATRCAGITGFMAAGLLSAAFSTSFSAHTAPSIHAHAACALPAAVNVEYFFDHYRIEQIFFDGALVPNGGLLKPDGARPGFGLECKRPDMERFKVYGNSAS
ncbi:MAG TPA: enolase C-terminal domain-like protein [Bryobacteraceae bacterium]|jgi:L-alanine-DL-glutamate epimerase-like enolase superfamily enzyme|nr:enolase C-terminal domain-like protein [Bryobacteraceae bacterium]